MLEDGRTWFLLADGRRARVVVEERRGAPLAEAWELSIGEEDTYDAQDRPPRSFDRVGAGRHAMDTGRNLHEQEESNFLKRLANKLIDSEKGRAFQHLAIAAPPRALGELRALLPEAVLARVRAETPKDVVDEDLPALRERLQELLRAS